MSVRKKRRSAPKGWPVQHQGDQQQYYQYPDLREQGSRQQMSQQRSKMQGNRRPVSQKPKTLEANQSTYPNAQRRSPQPQNRVKSRAVTWQNQPPSRTRPGSGRSRPRQRVNMTPILGFFIVAIVGLDVLRGSHSLWAHLAGDHFFVQPETTLQQEALTSPQSQPLLDTAPSGAGGGTNPKISVKTLNYDIMGDSADALRSQMSQLGPEDRDTGRRFDGFTSWNVDWRYHYKTVDGQCLIDQPMVETDVKITLPKWIPSPTAEPDLAEHWNRYITALTEHENGHRDHGIFAGREVAQMLGQLGGATSCQELGTVADQKGAEIVQRYAQADVDYDRETGHGATQGAIFP